MKVQWMIIGLSAVLIWSGIAQGQSTLPRLDKTMTGPQTQVLVLGTVHLDSMPKNFKPEWLEPVLAQLAAFKPNVITIEAISGKSCNMMAHYPTIYDPESLASFCVAPKDARAATGLDIPSAVAQVQKTLDDWPARPTAAQRRHLAALFLAASDEASALTQWLQIPKADQHAGNGLNDVLVRKLEAFTTRNSEDYLIAARLAARLGLQRVFPIDDHTGDNLVLHDERAFGKAIERAWNSASAKAKPMRDRVKALTNAGDMLALYRYINRPDVLRLATESDFGAALHDTSSQHYGQFYVAGWETRNLRMVANVRAAFRERPGARVLSIVGSSHKPWFDGLLGQMQGVQIVDAEKILNAPLR